MEFPTSPRFSLSICSNEWNLSPLRQTIQTNQCATPLTVQRAKISLGHADLNDLKNIKVNLGI